jgi:hypothetical protein
VSQNDTALDVGQLFFPQARALGIDRTQYSPAVLQKVVYAGAQSRSFRQAHGALAALAELDVSEKQVERLTEQIGDERVAQRNQAVEAFLKLPLMAKVSSPLAVSPDLAVVEMDGGRLQILDRAGPASEPASEQESTGDDPAYRDEPECDGKSARKDAGHWREDKIGVLIKMSSKESSEDPCPEIPEHFINPLFVGKLTREIHGSAAAVEQSSAAEVEAMKEEHAKGKHDWIPKPLVRTVVATKEKAKRFAEFLAQAAWARGFAGARRKAFVADGASTNWAIHRQWFSDYTGILDFIHCLSYVFAAAMAGCQFTTGWNTYVAWITALWGGQVDTVITGLEARQEEIGQPTQDEPDTSPRNVVNDTLRYLRNHRQYVRYDEYRRKGLPMTSSLMESTVKLINLRVKGTEKFWSNAGAEAILQLRADYLGETEAMSKFWTDRENAETGQRRYRRTA